MAVQLSRTWMVRGGVGAVLAVVSGAWALGIAATGGGTTAHDSNAPKDPETSSVSVPEEADGEVAGIVEDRDPSASADPSAAVPVVEASDAITETTGAAADEDPATPAAAHTSPAKTPAAPKPSSKPSKTPTPSHTPSPSPTPSPTQPGSRCTDLISGLNCVLAPITTRP